MTPEEEDTLILTLGCISLVVLASLYVLAPVSVGWVMEAIGIIASVTVFPLLVAFKLTQFKL